MRIEYQNMLILLLEITTDNSRSRTNVVRIFQSEMVKDTKWASNACFTVVSCHNHQSIIWSLVQGTKKWSFGNFGPIPWSNEVRLFYLDTLYYLVVMKCGDHCELFLPFLLRPRGRFGLQFGHWWLSGASCHGLKFGRRRKLKNFFRYFPLKFTSMA